MEKSGSRRSIAIIERCAMSESGLRHLLPMVGNYQFYFFKDCATFLNSLAWTPFFSLIYSLSASRAQRIECLKLMSFLERTCPEQQRLVLAGNDSEAQLVRRFTPASLHGIISKNAPLGVMRQQLARWLNDAPRQDEKILNLCYYHYEQVLNQNEWDVLYLTALGHPVTNIAVQLKRNCKSMRAHKLSLMNKLGVDTDAGLFFAADILVQMQKARYELPPPPWQIPA